MAKTNYTFAKRQRDLAKKKKVEEKIRRKEENQRLRQGEKPPEPPADEPSSPQPG